MRLISRKRASSIPRKAERGRALIEAYRLLLEEAKRAKAAAPVQKPKPEG